MKEKKLTPEQVEQLNSNAAKMQEAGYSADEIKSMASQYFEKFASEEGEPENFTNGSQEPQEQPTSTSSQQVSSEPSVKSGEDVNKTDQELAIDKLVQDILSTKPEFKPIQKDEEAPPLEPLDVRRSEEEAGFVKVKDDSSFEGVVRRKLQEIPKEDKIPKEDLEKAQKALLANEQAKFDAAVAEQPPMQKWETDVDKELNSIIDKAFPMMIGDQGFNQKMRFELLNDPERLARYRQGQFSTQLQKTKPIDNEEAFLIQSEYLRNKIANGVSELENMDKPTDFEGYVAAEKKKTDFVNDYAKFTNLQTENKPIIDKIRSDQEVIDELNKGGAGNFSQDIASRALNSLNNVAIDLITLPATIASSFEDFTGRGDLYTISDRILDYADKTYKNPLLVSERQFYNEQTGEYDLGGAFLGASDQVGIIAALALGNVYAGRTAIASTEGKLLTSFAKDAIVTSSKNVYTVAGGYAASLESNRRDAKEMGLSGGDAFAYTQFMSFLEGTTELIMPDNQIFSKEVKDIALKVFAANLSKGRSFAAKEALKSIGEIIGKENLEELLVLAGKTVQTGAIALENEDVEVYVPELGEVINTVATTTVASGTIPAIVSLNKRKQIENQMILKASKDPDGAKEVITQFVKKGVVKQEDAEAFLNKVAKSTEAVSEIPSNFTEEESAEVLDPAIRLTELREEAKNKKGVAKEQIDEEIKALEEQIRQKAEERKAKETTTVEQYGDTQEVKTDADKVNNLFDSRVQKATETFDNAIDKAINKYGEESKRVAELRAEKDKAISDLEDKRAKKLEGAAKKPIVQSDTDVISLDDLEISDEELLALEDEIAFEEKTTQAPEVLEQGVVSDGGKNYEIISIEQKKDGSRVVKAKEVIEVTEDNINELQSDRQVPLKVGDTVKKDGSRVVKGKEVIGGIVVTKDNIENLQNNRKKPLKVGDKVYGTTKRYTGDSAEQIAKDNSVGEFKEKEQEPEPKKRKFIGRPKPPVLTVPTPTFPTKDKPDIQEDTAESIEKELEAEIANIEKETADFVKAVEDEAVGKSKDKDLVLVKGNIYQVTRKPDGTFSVSKMRADGKLIGITRDTEERKTAISQFKRKQTMADNKNLSEAEKLIEDTRKESEDRILAALDKAIERTSFTALRGQANDVVTVLGYTAANLALKGVRAAYKTGMSLKDAIAFQYEKVKASGVTEIEFKKFVLESLKPQQNAVQEQTTSEVPVQPEAQVGEKMAEGKPQAETKVTAEESVKEEEINFGTAFSQQDLTAEITVGKEKDKWGEANFFREKVENAGDILRELSSRGKNPDSKYILEKIEKIKEWVAKSKEGFEDIPNDIKTLDEFSKSNLRFTNAIDGWNYAKRFYNDILTKTLNEYKAIDTYTEEQRLARDLVVDLLNNDINGVESKISEIENIANKVKEQRELPIVKKISRGIKQKEPEVTAQEGQEKVAAKTVTSETQGLTEKERNKQGFVEYTEAMKEKSAAKIKAVTESYKDKLKEAKEKSKSLKEQKDLLVGFANSLIKGLRENGVKDIPTAKVNTILNQVRKSNTQKSVDIALEELSEIAKQIEDKYSTDKAVRETTKKVRNTARAKGKSTLGQAAKAFSRINLKGITDMALLEEVAAIADELIKSAPKLTINDINEVIAKVEKAKEKTVEKKSFKDRVSNNTKKRAEAETLQQELNAELERQRLIAELSYTEEEVSQNLIEELEADTAIDFKKKTIDSFEVAKKVKGDLKKASNAIKKALDNGDIDETKAEELRKDLAEAAKKYDQEVEKIKEGEKAKYNKAKKQVNLPSDPAQKRVVQSLLDAEAVDDISWYVMANDILDSISLGTIPYKAISDLKSYSAYKSKAAKETADSIKTADTKETNTKDLVSKLGTKTASQRVRNILNIRDKAIWNNVYQPMITLTKAAQNLANNLIEPYSKIIGGMPSILNIPARKQFIKDSNKAGIVAHYIQEQFKAGLGIKADGVPVGARDIFGIWLGNEKAMDAVGMDEETKAKFKDKQALANYSKEEIKALEEIYSELVDSRLGYVDVANLDAEKVLSESQKKMYDAAREVFDSSASYQEAANLSRGSEFTPRIMYLPTKRKGGSKRASSTPPIAGYGNLNTLASAGKEKLTESLLPIVGVFSFDLNSIVVDHISDVALDYSFSINQPAINALLTSAVNQTENSPVAIAIKNDFNDSLNYQAEVAGDTAVKKLANALFGARYAKTLFDPIRSVVEFTSAVLTSVIKTGSINGITDVFDKKAWITLDKIKEDFDITVAEKLDSEKTRQNIREGLDKEIFYVKLGRQVMSAPEYYSAVGLFLPTMRAEFKKLTGSDLNLDLYLNDKTYMEENKDALLKSAKVGQEMVERIQDSKVKAGTRRYLEVPFSKATIKADSVFGKVVSFFGNYVYREQGELFTSLKFIAKDFVTEGKSMDSAELRNASGVLFNAMAYSYGMSLYYIAQQLTFGDDDDKEKAIQEYEELFDIKAMATNLVGQVSFLGLSKYGKIGRLSAITSLSLAYRYTDDKEAKELIAEILKDQFYIYKPLDFSNSYSTSQLALKESLPQLEFLLENIKLLEKTENITEDPELATMVELAINATNLGLTSIGTQLPMTRQIKGLIKKYLKESSKVKPTKSTEDSTTPERKKYKFTNI